MLLVGQTIEPDRCALVDAARGTELTYGRLIEAVADLAARLADLTHGVAFCFAAHDIDSVVGYLAAVEAGLAAYLVTPGGHPEHVEGLVARYRPEVLVNPPEKLVESLGAAGWSFEPMRSHPDLMVRAPDPARCHPALAVLLATSGSTGSPKVVRLARSAVEANAVSISRALDITPSERAITSLPISYSYGLSVLNSHLVAGASVVLTDESVLRGEFWDLVRAHACTSFAGVPYSYQILARTGFDPGATPSLRTMTQAGGRLAPDLVERFGDLMKKRDGRFFVMYGQTEATARMAVLPLHDHPERVGSVGLPIPGGSFEIRSAASDSPDPRVGEIVYSGPNVMMGYATSREDLVSGDELGGVLATGDLGYLDDDGFLHITGRVKRIAKPYGVRVDLDEVERLVGVGGPCAVVGRDSSLVIFREGESDESDSDLRRSLAQTLKLHHKAFEFRTLERLPRNANGKVDYATLQAQL